MEIILKEDVTGVGYKNDVVNVKPGYGRNYLIPQGFAVLATPSALKMREENIKQAAHKAEKLKQNAEDLASSIGDLTLEVKAKAGESGKIFGAVTPIQVSEKLKEAGFEVDRKRISFPTEIKMLGEYEAKLDLHKEVHHTIKVNVTKEG